MLPVTSYIPENIGRHSDASDLKVMPILDLLKRAGVRLRSGEQWVSATLAEPVVASRLKGEIGSPLLQIERLHFGAHKPPVQYVKILAVPRLFELRMRLGRGVK
jgi:GntR family transcriptional regulator